MLASIFGLAMALNISALAFQVVTLADVAYFLYSVWCMWTETGGLPLEKETRAKYQPISGRTEKLFD